MADILSTKYSKTEYFEFILAAVQWLIPMGMFTTKSYY